MEKQFATMYGRSLISGFWVWIILITNGDTGRDLLDVLIQYIGKF